MLKATYGKGVEHLLFLCGYFDADYLGSALSANFREFSSYILDRSMCSS